MNGEDVVQSTPRRNEPPRIPVETLLRGGREAIIEHGGEEYRLRLTSNSKLILTK